MKITNKTLLTSVMGLQELARLMLPVKTSYEIGKTMSEVQQFIDLYNKTGLDIRRKYSGDQAKQDELYNELRAIEVDIKVKKIKLSDLGENTRVSPGTLMALDWLIENSPVKEKKR